MKWWWPSTDTMCPLVVPNVIIPPPPTHPPTPPWNGDDHPHDEMVMTIHEHNVSTSCTERHYPPPTHPPTPPYQTLHAYVWERMRKCVRSEWWHDECMMKWWWSSKMCKLLTAANADVSKNKDTRLKPTVAVCVSSETVMQLDLTYICRIMVDAVCSVHLCLRYIILGFVLILEPVI